MCVCVCAFVCVCMYICVYVYIYICICIYIWIVCGFLFLAISTAVYIAKGLNMPATRCSFGLIEILKSQDRFAEAVSDVIVEG